MESVKDIDISHLCLETYPCIHDVVINTNDNKKYIIREVSAPEIMFYFLKTHKSISNHFSYYKNEFVSLIRNKNIYNYLNYYDNIDNAFYCHKVL